MTAELRDLLTQGGRGGRGVGGGTLLMAHLSSRTCVTRLQAGRFVYTATIQMPWCAPFAPPHKSMLVPSCPGGTSPTSSKGKQ